MANLEFAHTVDPDNKALLKRMHNDGQCRKQSLPTIPSSIALEIESNPFLRPMNRDFCSTYARQHNIQSSDALSVFTDIRLRRNQW